MNILICPDKFKGSLSAREAAEALAKGILNKRKKSSIQCIPLADGGEGTLEVIQQMHGGQWVSVQVNDPLFRPIEASYLWLADQKTAYIEMARASGLQLLLKKEQNPLKTSTFGTGELIRHAAEAGATTIVLTIGGSATNDAGIGMAAALGYAFLDAAGTALEPIGENLSLITEIKGSNPYPAIQFIVLSDVGNPLHGPQGAAHIYAKQKGANATSIKQLDKGLINVGQWLPADIPGAGAAGGLGAGAVYFLGAKIVPGASWLMDKIHFNRALLKADFIITGEGKIDSSTWGGKVVSEVVKRCDKVLKQTILVSGAFESSTKFPIFLDENEVLTISSRAKDSKDSIHRASKLLEQIGEEIAIRYLN